MTKFKNPFFRDADAYKRDVSPVNHYVQQAALYLHVDTKLPLQECMAFVKDTVKRSGPMPIKDKTLTYTERNEYGDREVVEGSYVGYIMDSVNRGLIVAPTLTSYLPHDQVVSHHVGYIEDRIERRDVVKSAMYDAISMNRKEEAEAKNIEQNGLKTGSNSLSGAQASMYNAIFNHSAHSTLTSNCRATSNYSSVNTEKILAGSRHYWGYDVAFNNITAIIFRTDYAALENVMQRFVLYYPSAQDVVDCIRHSSDKYWRNPVAWQLLFEYAQKLNPLQRAAFVYTSDLFHLAKHNSLFVARFIDQLSAYTTDYADNDCKATIKSADASVKSLAVQVMDEEMAGLKLKMVEGTQKETTACAIIDNIHRTLDDYRDFITVFLTTDNLPASVAYFPESVREVVLTGDTDSTIMTVEYWVAWMNDGIIGFDRRCNAVAAAMIFIAEQTIIHVLALMSTNIGIPKKYTFTIATKNEYKFPVYIPTQVGKHYWANKSCQEGLIFLKPEPEDKGVHLKNSNAPASINKASMSFRRDVITDVQTKQEIKLSDYIRRVILMEQEIMTSLRKGEPKYFRFQQIKPSTAYKNPDPMKNNYANYLFWQRVFAHSTAATEKPPYMAIKANLTNRNKTDTMNWINGIKSHHIKKALLQWLSDTKKTEIKTISIPLDVAQSKGIPPEIIDVLDVRKTAFDLCKSFYICLEALGQFTTFVNERKRFILSDLYDVDEDGNLHNKIPTAAPIELSVEEVAELVKMGRADYEREDPADTEPIDDAPF